MRNHSMDSTNNAICPYCGAQGTAGRFCEYCGTKIPIPIIETRDDEDGDFNWYTVCPRDYEPSFERVIGDYSQSLYMVVKTEVIEDNLLFGGKKSVEYYAIINRKGKFITSKEPFGIDLYVDNYDYFTGNKLINIITKETFAFDTFFDSDQIVGSLMIAPFFPRRIFNRRTRKIVELDENISNYSQLQKEISTEECLVFYDWEPDNEAAEKPDLKFIVTIVDDKGSITYEGNKKVRELPPYEKIKEDGMCQVFDDITIYRTSHIQDYKLFDHKNEKLIHVFKGPEYFYTFKERNSEGDFIFTYYDKINNNIIFNKTCTVRVFDSDGTKKAEATYEEIETPSGNSGCILLLLPLLAPVLYFLL